MGNIRTTAGVGLLLIASAAVAAWLRRKIKETAALQAALEVRGACCGMSRVDADRPSPFRQRRHRGRRQRPTALRSVRVERERSVSYGARLTWLALWASSR